MINAKEVRNKLTFFEMIKDIKWRYVILSIMSFFLGRVGLFENFYTLSIAYIGIIFWNKPIRRCSAAFAILGLLSMNGFSFISIKYIFMILMITALRELMSVFHYSLNLRNQLLIVSVTIASISGMTLSIDGFTVYKLMITLLETAIGLGLMSIFHLALTVISEGKKGVLSEYELASVAFLIAIYLCGMIDISIALPFVEQIYIKDVLVFIILIGATFLGGMQAGIIVSIIVSSVLVIIGYIPTSFVGVYVFAALMGGLFTNLERIGIIFAMTLGLLLGFTIFNDRVIDLPILGAYICATVISLIIPKHYFGMANWFERSMENDEIRHLLHVQTIISKKLKRFSTAFEGLGKAFETISFGNDTLDQAKLNQIIEDTGESVCKDCSMCQFCWDESLQRTYRCSYKMADTILEKGQIAAYDIPEPFRKACVNPEGFAFALSIRLEAFKKECRWQKQFEEARSLISEDFKGISDSVDHLVQDIESELYFNKEAEKRIKAALQTFGIRSKDVMVLEKNDQAYEIHIYCHYRGDTSIKEWVLEAVKEAMRTEIEVKKYEYFLEEHYCYFQLGIKKKYTLAISAQNKAKNGTCGDVYTFMELEDGQYLMALADGMGSGDIAHRESEGAIELLENFLEAGFQSEVALRMINSALVLKSNIECYTTMDMALFNEQTGAVEFLKMGASTSFILRKGEIMTVHASSLPIGLLSQVDIMKSHKQLREGDVIIMVTDGMLEDRNALADSEETFKHFILEAESDSPEYLSKFLLSKAKNLMAGQEGDDMTILVAKVQKQYE